METRADKDWKAALFISRQEEQSYRSPSTREAWIRAASLYRQARPYIEATNLPAPFTDWNGVIVDMRLEEISDPAYMERLATTFASGGAIAMQKGGSWYAIRSTNLGAISRGLEVNPISEADALNMLHLPIDWQDRVQTGL